MMPALRVQNLTKDFGLVRAVDDVSFDVPRGAVTGFVGANGSGKTTTMRVMLGLLPATSGTALFGDCIYRDLVEPRKTVGAVVDRIGAHPGHSARDHLTMIARAANLPVDRVEYSLGEVGLRDVADRSLRTYSMGMTQRCALAAALLGDPNVLILDEPANGLDPAGIRWLREKTRAWADEGKAVLISTHQLAELAEVVDHLVVLHHGRVAYADSAAEIIGRGQALEDTVLEITDALDANSLGARA